MTMIIRDSLANLAPYHVEDEVWNIKLDANEKTSPLPPVVAEQIEAALQKVCLQRYPASDEKLRQLIASRLGVTAEQIALGCGSSEVLLALCQAFGGAGRKIVFPSPSFSMYGIYTQITDSIVCAVPLNKDFSLPVDDFIAAAQAASLAILCNPNNPTGNILGRESIEKVLSSLTCPVIVDEAYVEFYGPSTVELLTKYPQLIVARTFSKAYGLAATRVGYMVASPKLIELINKVLLPYHVNALSLAAAEVVCQNQELFEDSIQATMRERERLSVRLATLAGMTVYPSQTNFIMIRLKQAAQLAESLANQGTAIRSFAGAPGLEGCLRITVGTQEENDTLFKQIEKFLKCEVK
ncbi:histidinol-phosphate aminotransferase [Sporomusaceae bacterium BoRhaA]|uniref:histidinol-phosphate transaminase n=1 Tax=Pelorhabdus rhamnosifermentans TaxID=2772457 RepID=UPI001FE93586|nr:histidinol-phosphate transaminase [Pelorhabdus rhamnosifermentans]MBU2702634.1 histidinol-phosphate aminotransferase [Pelorhabdus rhamnosifermentans]